MTPVVRESSVWTSHRDPPAHHLGPQSPKRRHPTAVWPPNNLQPLLPKTFWQIQQPATTGVWTLVARWKVGPSFLGKGYRAMILPAACSVALQSHPYESELAGPAHTEATAAARQGTVQCTFCRAQSTRVHTRERGEETGEQRVHFALQLALCSVCSSRHHSSAGRQSFCWNCCEYRWKSCDNENRRNGHLLKRIKSWVGI